MKVGLILHGNLRTFLMPMRENPSTRVCDVFMRNIVRPNDADVFVATDTTAFYHNGVEYFSSDNIDIFNGESFRVHNKASQITHEAAKSIIQNELASVIRKNLKSQSILNPVDVTSDDKFKILSGINAGGSTPTMLVQQYRKIKIAHDALLNFEHANKIKYDILIKCRADNMYPARHPLVVQNFNYSANDVYAPGVKGPMVLDWYAFGRRPGMDLYLSLYDNLGTIIPAGRTYIHECTRCGTAADYGPNESTSNACPNCRQRDMILKADITISSEHHIFRMFQRHGIRVSKSDYPVYVYRYKDTSNNAGIPQEVHKGLGLNINIHRSEAK